MKNILFKALSLKGQWVEGIPHTYEDKVFMCQVSLMSNNGLDWRVPGIEVDPETIVPYLRNDMNCKPTFGGDIIRYKWKRGEKRIKTGEVESALVNSGYGYWHPEKNETKWHDHAFLVAIKFENTGKNIHDTP